VSFRGLAGAAVGRLNPTLALAAALALLAAGVAVAIYDASAYRAQKLREIEVQPLILSSTVSAALAFNDQKAAQEYVRALKANPEVEIAAVYDAAGGLFASYVRPGAEPPPNAEAARRIAAADDRLAAAATVEQDDVQLGAAFLQARTEPLGRRLARYGAVALLAIMASLMVTVLGAAHRTLSQYNRELEARVEARTRELTDANEQLRTEIAERKQAEGQKQILMAELEHRVKNALAVAQSLVHHTRASSATVDEFADAFGGRLRAMGKAQNLLVRGDWRGAELGELLDETVRPYLPREEALTISGPSIQLSPAAASSLAMILHELATNAAKYGAWSRDGGAVAADWSVRDGELVLVWRESGGPAVSAPKRRGFGSRMIEHNTAYELAGRARLEFRPDGLVCELAFRLP